MSEFGAAKVRVVANCLLQINPHLTFYPEDLQPWSATMHPDRLAAMLADVDLVVATTADEGVESFSNQQVALLGKPVIHGRALRQGNVGRIFLVRPERDACKTCLALYAANGRSGESVPEGWIDVPEAADVALLHECGRPVIPGSGIDLAFIAALAARVALTVLEGGDGNENHWIWTKELAIRAWTVRSPRWRPRSHRDRIARSAPTRRSSAS